MCAQRSKTSHGRRGLNGLAGAGAASVLVGALVVSQASRQIR